ncbi:MAG: hypothetical protein LQ339_006607 [Xanthoria mediterranea]|nr:MAG: hypothetical protein LQ339_006607 [Xanthoria mediterranea]
MRPLLLSFSIAVALVAATPTHQLPRFERGPSSKFVNVVSNPVRHTADFVRRQEQPANGSSDVDPLTSLSEQQKAEVQKATEEFTKPLGNAAIWKEAYDFDLERGDIHENRIFYHIVAFFQLAENSSLTVLRPKNIDGSYADQNVGPAISKALQYVQFYPAQLEQPQASDPENTIVQLSPDPQQTIASFGASGAWWPNFLKDFPPAQQKNLSALLFSEDWLHLSGYRYNLGGSGGVNDSAYASTPGRGVESFMTTDGAYDWTRDAGGVYYLKAANEAKLASITAFVNSMPSALTETKKACGNALTAAAIPQFTAYLNEVLTHLAEEKIKIDYISPMNEPGNDFGECTQEGMSVDKTLRAEVFENLRATLNVSTSPIVQKIKIMGDESSQIASGAFPDYPSWLAPTLASKYIDAIAVHMYDWPDDATLLNYRQLVINSSLPNPPPPIKQTEISSFASASGLRAPFGWTGPKMLKAEYDPGINSALDMGRYIWQWLTLVNAESWDWWTAVSNVMPCSPSTIPSPNCDYANDSGYNDGLLYIDPAYATTKDYNFYFTKRFWVFRHFSHFLRPGAVRYDVPNEILPYGTVAVAAKNVDDVYATIFINRNATGQTITMKLPGAGAKVIGAVQTTDKEDFGTVALPVVGADGTFKLDLPAKGVLTIQFSTVGARAAAGPGASKRDIEEAGRVHRKREKRGGTGGG